MSIACQRLLVLILKKDLITVSESQLFFVIFALCHINHDKSFKETITIIRSPENSKFIVLLILIAIVSFLYIYK